MPDIPSPEDVTPAWLTDCLRKAGHSTAEVRGFESTRIGTGQIGMCVRYVLDVVGGDASTPTSLASGMVAAALRFCFMLVTSPSLA